MNDYKVHKIKWTDEKVSRLWDYYSSHRPYNDIYFTKSFGKDILRRALKSIPFIDNAVVLDYGCGPAFLIDHISDMKIHPKQYIGLDYSRESVNNIKHKETEFDKRGLYVSSLPSTLVDNSIDVCFLIEVIEHLSDEHLHATLSEIKRILKPGGSLVITTPNEEDLEVSNNYCPDCGCIYHKWQHIRSFNPESLKETLSKCGLSCKDTYPTKFRIEKMGIVSKFKYLVNYLRSRNDMHLFGVFIK